MSKLQQSVLTVAILASASLPGVAFANNNSTNNCLSATDPGSYVASFTRDSGTIATKNGLPLCSNVTLTLENFTMPDSWDGKSFNETALPQYKNAKTSLTIPSGQANFKQTYKVTAPAICKNTQIDFYFGNGYDKLIGLHDDDATWIDGKMFKGSGSCATPTPTITPKPTVTPKPTSTPVPTKSPVPVASPTPTPSVLGTSTNLPDTGAEGIIGAFGLTAMVATAGVYLKQRLNRS